MKRIVVFAILFLLVGATSAAAQEPTASPNAPAAPSENAPDPGQSSPVKAPGIFSKASIDKAVIRAGAPAVPQTKKPFFKTPWPYVIAAAAVVILVFALRGSGPMGNGLY
jgi:hypothetical protein